jgi:hypothetical protein
MPRPKEIREYRPHRLLIPVVAALAVTLSVVFFHGMESRGVTPDSAAHWAAILAFGIVAVVGIVFKPLLGE